MRGYANAVPVTWKGVAYRSIAECARALGLTAPTIAKRLREGTPLDEPPRPGIDAETELKYKQLTGIVELFRKVNYSVSWSSDGNNRACREFDEVSKE